MWSIYNLGQNLLACNVSIFSGIFTTQDGSTWQLELRFKDATFKMSDQTLRAKVIVHAIANPKELSKGRLERKLSYRVSIHRNARSVMGFESSIFEQQPDW